MADKKPVIGGKYEVQGPCSNAGGMGTLLFVSEKGAKDPVLVLKLCKLSDPEMLARFRREVRVMQDFNGNAYVMPILDANLDHDPPYFVMPHYEQGDLMAAAASIRNDVAQVETVFNRMIDCLAQLHDKDVLHRDIKPQNFLLSGNTMVVSDLGLCSEKESTTCRLSTSTVGSRTLIPRPTSSCSASRSTRSCLGVIRCTLFRTGCHLNCFRSSSAAAP